MRQAGHEFGTTTDDHTRCGWLDMVALRYAFRINGLTELVLSKLDVLNDFDQIHLRQLMSPRKPVRSYAVETAVMANNAACI
jgi:adenylosuccinate synthase